MRKSNIWKDNEDDDDDEGDNEDAIDDKSSAFHERIHSPFHYDLLKQVEEAKYPPPPQGFQGPQGLQGGLLSTFRNSGKSSLDDDNEDKEGRRTSLTLTRTISSRAGAVTGAGAGRSPQTHDFFSSTATVESQSESSGSVKSNTSYTDSYTHPQTADRFSFPAASSPIPTSSVAALHCISAISNSYSAKQSEHSRSRSIYLQSERELVASTGAVIGERGGSGRGGSAGEMSGRGSTDAKDLSSSKSTPPSPSPSRSALPLLSPDEGRDDSKDSRSVHGETSSLLEDSRRGRESGRGRDDAGLDNASERLTSYISDSSSSSFHSTVSPPSASDSSLPMTVSSPFFTLRLDVSGDSDSVSEIDETVKTLDYPEISPQRPLDGSPPPAPTEEMSSMDSHSLDRNSNSNQQQQQQQQQHQRRQQRGDSKASEEDIRRHRGRGRGDGYTSQSLSPTPSTSTSASPYSPLLTPSSSKARTTKNPDRKSYGGM